jgi:predicted dehydrogenase
VERFRPVRIGLVGYSKGGRFFHAPLIAAAVGCELAGVVTRSAQRRGDLERDHPGTPAYDDLAQLASAGVDAVAMTS